MNNKGAKTNVCRQIEMVVVDKIFLLRKIIITQCPFKALQYSVYTHKNLYKLKLKRIFSNRLTNGINQVFETMLFSQFIGSRSIICLTAFEASVTLSDRLACVKFIVYMFAAFMQIFFWCWVGNKTYYQVKLQQGSSQTRTQYQL